jgi:molecular chaperone DnaJ
VVRVDSAVLRPSGTSRIFLGASLISSGAFSAAEAADSAAGGALRGSDLRYDLEIGFEDAVYGNKIEIGFQREASCSACSGYRSRRKAPRKRSVLPAMGPVKCGRSSGFFSIAQPCPTCQGEGSIIEKPCKVCRGAGVVKKNNRIKVTIPAGIASGKRIRIEGQGDAGPGGGPPGDLYVVFHVKAHEYFERSNNDLHCVIPITLAQASLGDSIQVKTLDKKTIKVKIPPGTQNGKKLRIKNEGVPYLQSSARKGDLYITILVEVPTSLNSKQQKLLEELRALDGDKSKPSPVKLSNL